MLIFDDFISSKTILDFSSSDKLLSGSLALGRISLKVALMAVILDIRRTL